MKIIVENLNFLESGVFIRHFNFPSLEFVFREEYWETTYKTLWLNVYFWKWVIKIKIFSIKGGKK